MNYSSFRQRLDAVMLVSGPAIPGQGEDSACCVSDDSAAMVSVFDGCGGLGARTYPGFQDHTGAYLASRLLSGAAHDWFFTPGRDQHAPAEALRGVFTAAYAAAQPFAAGQSLLRGSMVRDLPSTAALAYARHGQGGVELHVVWAGDSRVYLLDRMGLAQLTADDVDGTDALSGITGDGALTNVISSDGNYTLHSRALLLTEPTMVLAATDGCFGYLRTPMEFEYLLLSHLVRAQNPQDYRRRLNAAFGRIAGDDYSLGIMSFHFSDFSSQQRFFGPRAQSLYDYYVHPLEQSSDAALRQRLWASYRPGYERCL